LWRWGGWFLAANTPLVWAACFRGLEVAGWPEDGWARLFLVVASLGQFTLLALVPMPLLAVLVLIWPRPRVTFGVGVLVSSLLVLALAVDGVVYNLYRFHLNGMVWSLISEGGMFEILPISVNTWAVVGLLVVAVFGLEVLVAWGTWRWVVVPRRGGWHVTGVILGLNLASHGLHAYLDAVQHVPALKVARALPAYRPLTVKRTLRKLGWLPDRKEPAVKFDGGRTHLRYPLEALNCAPPATPLNIVLIVIDSWRQDMLSPQVTPAIWRFSETAIRFERHTAVADTTRYGIFSLFYGLYGSYWNAMLAEQRGPVLLDELDRAGYDFGVWGSASLTSPEFDRTVFARLRDRIDLTVSGERATDRDLEIQRRFLAFLDRRDPEGRPFFGFVFYDSSHAYQYPPDAAAPFQPVPAAIDHLTLNRRTDPAPLRNKYMNAVHWVDGLVAQVLARLEARQLLDCTIVVVTGDHGEEFNDSGGNYWGHNGNFTRFQTDVPLVVRWPGRTPGRVDYVTSHLDVAPTFLREVLGCSLPEEQYSLGRSLFDPTPRYPLAAASWGRLALLTEGRVDTMADAGPADHTDREGRDLQTPIPPGDLQIVLEGMGRFLGR
jgi:hypothetical protein